SFETIKETTNFLKNITEFLPRSPIISINALVTLPGTPVYEYARHRGFLGESLRDEEHYLSMISDQTGGKSVCQINLTDYPYLIVFGWIRCIIWAVKYHYIRKNKIRRVPAWKLFFMLIRTVSRKRKVDSLLLDSLYGNTLFYHLRYVVAPLDIMLKTFREDKGLFRKRCYELLTWPSRKKRFTDYIALRRFLSERAGHLKDVDQESVQILRLGR
ncbi:hypothetical protein ACFL3J_02275, partial [Candidatus Omnitrophota bacterium]